jgi:hypothetical protein
MSDIGLNIDILTKIGTIIYEDTYGRVWFKLMMISNEFNSYAKSPVGVAQFMNFSERVDLTIDNWTIRRLLGRFHRNHKDDLPALMSYDCSWWYKNGEMHRDNGLPAIINAKRQHWYKNGLLHRDNGPALVHVGNTCADEWYKNNVRIK